MQNWYAGDKEGEGGIYNFVTKRGKCAGENSKISWTQVETGSAITWKYPSVILQGDNSVGEFYSRGRGEQQAAGRHGHEDDPHRPQHEVDDRLARASRRARATTAIAAGCRCCRRRTGARNYTQCDSMLVGNHCGAHTFPYIEVGNNTAIVEHEASTSKIGEDQIFYLKQRGLSAPSRRCR